MRKLALQGKSDKQSDLLEFAYKILFVFPQSSATVFLSVYPAKASG